jgi:hypothetical protein
MIAVPDPIAVRPPTTQGRLYVGVFAGALVLSVVFCESLAAYWAHYRLGTAGGNGMALVLIALPGSFVIGGLLGTLVARRAVRRGASPRLGLGQAMLAVIALLAVLLVVEVLRTRTLRASQDESASLPAWFASPEMCVAA